MVGGPGYWTGGKHSWVAAVTLSLLAVLGLRCSMGFSLTAASRGYSGVAACRLYGFSSCSSWLRRTRSGVMVMGLVALRQVESSQTRDGPQVSCTGRQILFTEPSGKPGLTPNRAIEEFHTLDSAQGCTRAVSQAPELRRWSDPPLLSGSHQ